jgi:HSP20 family protein
MNRWMWGEAVDLLEQAERLQRQFFRLAAGTREQPRWEPPVDVYASEHQVLVEVALPGVPLERMELVIGPGEIVIRGDRALPRRPEGLAIQRLEIPYGRFERRLALGPGRLGARGPQRDQRLSATAAGPALKRQAKVMA